MSSKDKSHFSTFLQIVMILLAGTILSVAIYAFFIPGSLLDELFIVGASFALITGAIIYILQFTPLMNELTQAQTEAEELLKSQNTILEQQAKSLRSAYNHSLKKLKRVKNAMN